MPVVTVNVCGNLASVAVDYVETADRVIVVVVVIIVVVVFDLDGD